MPTRAKKISTNVASSNDTVSDGGIILRSNGDSAQFLYVCFKHISAADIQLQIKDRNTTVLAFASLGDLDFLNWFQNLTVYDDGNNILAVCQDATGKSVQLSYATTLYNTNKYVGIGSFTGTGATSFFTFRAWL